MSAITLSFPSLAMELRSPSCTGEIGGERFECLCELPYACHKMSTTRVEPQQMRTYNKGVLRPRYRSLAKQQAPEELLAILPVRLEL